MAQGGGDALRKAILVTAALWLFYYFISLLPVFVIPPERSPPLPWVLTYRFFAMVIGFGLSMAIYLLVRRLQRLRFWQQLGAVLLVAVPAGEVFLLVERFTLATASSGRFPPSLPPIDPFIHLQRTLFWAYFFMAWAIGIMALLYSERAAAEARMRAKAQALAHDAQLRSLRYQLNPHFLFNTLNSVAALVLDGRAEAAELMLRRLSNFLRAGLTADPGDQIPLVREIAQQKLYLEIERVRFPDRLAFEVDIPSEAEHVPVPSLILQPLVENAVKYAVAPSKELTTIRISADVQGELLTLAVKDDGSVARPPEGGTGIGLGNVRQRLEAVYGDAFRFEAGPRPEGGFCATLQLPFERAGDEL